MGIKRSFRTVGGGTHVPDDLRQNILALSPSPRVRHAPHVFRTHEAFEGLCRTPPTARPSVSAPPAVPAERGSRGPRADRLLGSSTTTTRKGRTRPPPPQRRPPRTLTLTPSDSSTTPPIPPAPNAVHTAVSPLLHSSLHRNLHSFPALFYASFSMGHLYKGNLSPPLGDSALRRT